jgi:parallel beta-helix repeat protein
MKPSYRLAVAGIFWAVPLFFAVASEGATICVDPNNAPPCQATIQGGVDAANVGDTVKIVPGIYPGKVVIPPTKHDITLAGVDQVIINPGSADGIRVQANNVTLKTLTVQGGHHGIGLHSGSAGAHLLQVRVQGTSSDCIAVESPNVEIVDSELSNCGDDGIDANDQGDTHALSVRNTTITGFGSGDDGIHVDRANAQLEGNTIDGEGTGGDCIEAESANAVVQRNTVNNCGRDGIEVIGANPTVVGNVATAADRKGYEIRCLGACDDGLVQDNTASQGSDDGFDIRSESAGLLVKKNQASENDDRGFVLRGLGGIEVRNNQALNNGVGDNDDGFKIYGANHILRGNKAQGNADDGFDIEASKVQLINNKANGNLEDGFDVGSGRTFVGLTKNQADDNVFQGIEVEKTASFTTVERNKASGNQIDFCDAGTNTTVSGNSFGTTQTGSCPN